ncbi:MAG: hypothetical protein ACYSTZ_00065 [Planctomycetota bacterium]
MADKLKDKDVKTPFHKRLQFAVNDWREYTLPMRELRKKMLRHYAAGWYENRIGENQPLNLIDRAVNIIGPYLVSQNPKVNILPKRGLQSTRSFARTMELALEHLFHELMFSDNTLRPAVFNSLFCMGIVKTGIAEAYQVEIDGITKEVGQPYADSIDFEDYIGDFRARNRQEQYMEGNSYCLPLEYVCDSGLYKNYDRLSTVKERMHDDETSPDYVAKRNMMPFEHKNEIRKMVWLNDIWIPEEGVTVTLPEEGQGCKPMREVGYDGPEFGPYDSLTYHFFPNSIVPVPPIYNMVNLNSIINRLLVKMKDQADREKKVMAYELGAADDAELIRNTSDGFTVGVKNTDAFKEVEFGGVSDANFGFVNYLEQQYSIQGGNLYTIGGRESQAETLGQEQMLQANASKQLQDMVLKVHNFTRSITRKLSWYLWSDPYIQIPVIKELAGFKLKVSYTPDVREGDFFDYGFDIEPYSMAMMSPETRYQRLLQLVGQVVLPTAPIAAQQGSQLNVSELVQECARFLDVRNIERWWSSAIPTETAANPYQPEQGTPSGGPSGKQGDGRFSNADNDASNMNNNLQHMNRTGGETSSAAAAGAQKGY